MVEPLTIGLIGLAAWGISKIIRGPSAPSASTTTTPLSATAAAQRVIAYARMSGEGTRTEPYPWSKTTQGHALIKDFQIAYNATPRNGVPGARHDLPQDGNLDGLTYQALEAYGLNQRGPEVDQLSRDLIGRVLSGQTVSPQEIHEFQAKWGLPQTGLIDEATLTTMRALRGHESAPPGLVKEPEPKKPLGGLTKVIDDTLIAVGLKNDTVEVIAPPTASSVPNVTAQRLRQIPTVTLRPTPTTLLPPAITGLAVEVGNDLLASGPTKYSREGVKTLQRSLGMSETGLYDQSMKNVLDGVVDNAPPVYVLEPAKVMVTFFGVQKTEKQVLMDQYDELLAKWRANAHVTGEYHRMSSEAQDKVYKDRLILEAELARVGAQLLAMGVTPKPISFDDVPWMVNDSVSAATPPPAPAAPAEVDIRNIPQPRPSRE